MFGGDGLGLEAGCGALDGVGAPGDGAKVVGAVGGGGGGVIGADEGDGGACDGFVVGLVGDGAFEACCAGAADEV